LCLRLPLELSIFLSNDAFFAADTGAECALFYDRSALEENAFIGRAKMECAGSPVTLLGSAPSWNFIVSKLGTTTNSCAIVSVTKDTDINDLTRTKIISRGYNTGGSVPDVCIPGSNAVVRELEVNY
jgi:hypothetical protein